MLVMTIPQMNREKEKAVKALVKEAGGQKHLARMLGVRLRVVVAWLQRGAISKRGMVLVYSHPLLKDNFPLKRLRPDLAYDLDFDIDLEL